MNETKVSDAELREYACVIGGRITMALMAQELLAHRASRPLEQAVVEAARGVVPPTGMTILGEVPGNHPYPGSVRHRLYLALAALDAAAKQAGGGATDAEKAMAGPYIPPAPSSPPREAWTREDARAAMGRVFAGFHPPGVDAMVVPQMNERAARILESAMNAVEKVASSAAAERAGRGWKEANEDLCAQLADAEAEVARLKDLLGPAWSEFREDMRRLKPAQPAAGGEAERKTEAMGRVVSSAQTWAERTCAHHERLWQRDGECAACDRIMDAEAVLLADLRTFWAVCDLDARSSARAGG